MTMAGIVRRVVISRVKTLVLRSLAILVIFAANRLYAAAPESAAGMIYYDDTVTSLQSQASDARVLRADGTFHGLFHLSTYGTIRPGQPTDGTWSYRKTGSDTGEITFGPGNDVRRLTFLSDEHGSLRGVTNAVLYGRFKLVDPARRAPLINTSNRSHVPAGGAAITGFVVTENVTYALIRAVGPGLATFGVSPTVGTPILELAAADGMRVRTIGWDTDIAGESLRRTTEFAGAFPLQTGSHDAAIIVPLAPGAYTAKVTGGDPSATGEVLIEVYLLR